MPSQHHPPLLANPPADTKTKPPDCSSSGDGGHGAGRGVRSKVRAMVDWLEKLGPAASSTAVVVAAVGVRSRKATPFAAHGIHSASNPHSASGDVAARSSNSSSSTLVGNAIREREREMRELPRQLAFRKQREQDMAVIADRGDSGMSLRLSSCSSSIASTLRSVSSVYSQDGDVQGDFVPPACLKLKWSSIIPESEDFKTPKPPVVSDNPSSNSRQASSMAPVPANAQHSAPSMTAAQTEVQTREIEQCLPRQITERAAEQDSGRDNIPVAAIGSYDKTLEQDALEVLRYRQFFHQRLDRCLDGNIDSDRAMAGAEGDTTPRCHEVIGVSCQEGHFAVSDSPTTPKLARHVPIVPTNTKVIEHPRALTTPRAEQHLPDSSGRNHVPQAISAPPKGTAQLVARRELGDVASY
ncbi:hypothetical protein MN608_08022 [Microdochium nivale]|nr:hypothetical protein MN608_08022 [Microdochium nivale]